jgi:hypothetical protein
MRNNTREGGYGPGAAQLPAERREIRMREDWAAYSTSQHLCYAKFWKCYIQQCYQA